MGTPGQGTWIDGKPIYRQVIVTTLPIVATHGTYVYSPIQLGCSVDHVLSLTGSLTNNAGSCYTIPYTSNDSTGQTKAYVEKSRSVIYLSTNQIGFSGCPITVIVEYTKTTDSATIPTASATALMNAYDEGVNEA